MKTWERAAEIMKACRLGWLSTLEVAEAVGMDPQKTKPWLDGLASRGLLMSRRRNEKRPYGSPPVEFTVAPAWRGEA